ncbi:helix-turn-helix domain-containing protein, partial [Staphylococcus aureus]
ELSRRTGIGRNSISDYLNGKYEAKQDKVFELAKALNVNEAWPVSYTHLRAHETLSDLVCRLLLEKKDLVCRLLLEK